MTVSQVPGEIERSSPIDPMQDPRAWVSNIERITHEAALEEWLALYSKDAVLESIVDGGVERSDGIEEIRRTAGILVKVFVAHHVAVHKQLVAAADDVLVNSWTGGFDGGVNQRGVEIWTFRNGLVHHHQMFTFLDVLPASSLRARLRATVGGQLRVKLTLLRETARAGRH
jgi:hypothetical protein